MGTTNFKIRYRGNHGDENFNVTLMGKKYQFHNIGTNSRSQGFIIPSSTATNLKLEFENAKSGTITKYKEKVTRHCRRRRRWGRRRRRCSNKTERIPYTVNFTRRVIIESIQINGFEVKNFLGVTVTSCDPKKGNVSNVINVPNGIIISGGFYEIPKEKIQQSVGEFVPKPEFDEVAQEIPPLEKTITELKNSNSKLTDRYSNLNTDHIRLQAEYDKLLKKDVKNTKKIKNASTKINLLTNDAETLSGQIRFVEDNLQSKNQQAAILNQKYNSSEGKYFQEIEKENKDLKQENNERKNVNSTFKQKTFYQNESTKYLKIYNYYAFYIYYFMLLAFLAIFFYVENKNKTLSENIYSKIFFILIALAYPYFIHFITKYALNFFNYIYSILNSVVYRERIN